MERAGQPSSDQPAPVAATHAPFILTAELPDGLAGWATALRQAHFPPERNFLKAHVTLFHALPPSAGPELRRLLARVAGEFAAPQATLTGVMSLGRGTAFAISSPALLMIRESIAEYFHGSLSRQDAHTPRLHITVQNKVEPAAAKALQMTLAEGFQPRNFAFPGLGLHLYRGGPWEAAGRWSFRGKQGC